MHLETVRALGTLRERGDTLCIVPQNLYEFWNVCTRPLEKNGLGKSSEEADKRISYHIVFLNLLLDRGELFSEWRRLVVQCAVKGVQVHDARIAAAMRVHGITHLLTFNGDDFKRYPGITVVHPSEIS